MLVREVEAAAEGNDFRTTYPVTKELVHGRKLIDGPAKDHDDEQLKRQQEYFTAVYNRISFGEVSLTWKKWLVSATSEYDSVL